VVFVLLFLRGDINFQVTEEKSFSELEVHLT